MNPENEYIGEFVYHNGEWWQHNAAFDPDCWQWGKWEWIAGEWKD